MQARKALLLASTLLAAAPGTAVASNSASTHAFIVANYAFVRASDARLGVIKRKTNARMHSLLRQCPHAAAGSPQDEQAYQLSYEAAGALWSAAYGADAGPIAALVGATQGLRWSNAKTAAEVKRYVSSLHGLAVLPLQPVCRDIATWKASGFQRVPEHTRRFDVKLEALEATPVPPRLLIPYEQPGDSALLRQTQRIETKLLNFETQLGAKDWYTLTEGLSLNP